MNVILKDNEEIHSLDINGLKIIQSKNAFRFGMDAVLLSDFAKDIKNQNVMDLCSGNGAISLLLSAKTKNNSFTAVEIQEDVSDLAKRSVSLNNLDSQISVICMDLKNLDNTYKAGSFGAIVCNPPYKKFSSGITNISDTKTIARHEVLCSLDDVIRISSFLLKSNGSFYMVHRPERLCDIITTLHKYNLEPKIMRFIQPNSQKPANLLLIKAVKNAKPFLKLLPNLTIYDKNGNYTNEFLKIYNMI